MISFYVYFGYLENLKQKKKTYVTKVKIEKGSLENTSSFIYITYHNVTAKWSHISLHGCLALHTYDASFTEVAYRKGTLQARDHCLEPIFRGWKSFLPNRAVLCIVPQGIH